MKYRTLQKDPLARWSKGEIGVSETNDSLKYDLKLRFDGFVSSEIFGQPINASRVFYFFLNEVELVEESV